MYVFTDAVDLKEFIRKIEQKRPSNIATRTIALRGTSPYVAISPPAGTKAIDAEIAAITPVVAGAAVLIKKVGSGTTGNLPEWLTLGYGRAATIRGEKSESKVSTYRGKVKNVVLATGSKAITVKDIWSAAAIPNADIAAASFVEFLAFGPGQEKFQQFAKSLRISDDDADTDATPESLIHTALTAVEWSPEALDTTWKDWVRKGK
jgi:hypothetical protein